MTQNAFIAAVAAALLVAAGASIAQEPSPSGQTFTSEVDVIAVDVIVVDKDGKPVEGLKAEDFVVKENGQPQAITSFESFVLPESPPPPRTTRTRMSTNVRSTDEQGRTFVIVFDDLHMAEDRAIFAKDSLKSFLEDGLRTGDQVALVPTSGGAWWFARVPEGLEDVVAAMQRLEGQRPRRYSTDRMSDWEAMRLYVYRDRQVGAEVVRRYYEHRVLLEAPNVAENEDLMLGDHNFIRIKAAEVYQAAIARRKATMRTLERVAESLVGVEGRKSILLVSEGFVHEPGRDEFRIVADASRRANAAIYFVDARGLQGMPATADAELMDAVDLRDLGMVFNQDFLEVGGSDNVAADTGGYSLKNRNDIATGLRKVADESRAYYLVGYVPENTRKDGKYRKIKVEVNRDDVTVRARKGYYAVEENESIERDDDEEELDPTIRRALDSPHFGNAIPLRMSTFVLGPTPEGRSMVLVVAEADPRAFALTEQGGRFTGTLESFVMVSGRDRGENYHREKRLDLSLPPPVLDQLKKSWVPLVRDFKLEPGVYQALLMLRDPGGGTVGTVRHGFEVPEAVDFRTSTPVLTDTLQKQPEGSNLPPRPVPVARRTFAPGARLYYAVEVFGAAARPGSSAPSVRSGYSIRRADGSTVRTVDPGDLPAGPGGRLATMFSFSLEGISPGDYEIVLHVTDQVAGKTLEVVDPFIVAPRGTASLGPDGDGRRTAEARPGASGR